MQPALRRRAIHTAQRFGKELAVQVRQYHADGVRACETEVARAGVGNVAQRIRRGPDAVAQVAADVAVPVQRARDRGDGNRRFASHVADRGMRHRLPVLPSLRPATLPQTPLVGWTLRLADLAA